MLDHVLMRYRDIMAQLLASYDAIDEKRISLKEKLKYIPLSKRSLNQRFACVGF